MEMILISSSKLKVMLSSVDLEALELNFDIMDYSNTETRRALWSILDSAREKTGFDAAKKRISVQVYPSKAGGCELFVTKLSDKRRRDSGAHRETMKFSVCRGPGHGIYRFERLDGLLSACRALCGMGYPGKSSAYCDRDCGICYLSLDESGRKFPFVAEFGGRRLAARSPAWEYIAEHCTAICENDAVERLSPLA